MVRLSNILALIRRCGLEVEDGLDPFVCVTERMLWGGMVAMHEDVNEQEVTVSW